MKFRTDLDSRMGGRQKMCLNCTDYKDKNILDIGCSYGWFEKFVEAREIIAIDPCEKDLDIARTINKDKPHIIFKKGSIEDLKTNKEKDFDIVVMFDVIEHLPPRSEKKAMEIISSKLKKNGTLVISTPYNNFTKFLDPAWYVGHRHYSINKLKNIMNEEFIIESAVIRGGFFDIVGLNLFYLYKWLFNSEIPFKKYLDKKRDEEYLNKSGSVTLYLVARKK